MDKFPKILYVHNDDDEKDPIWLADENWQDKPNGVTVGIYELAEKKKMVVETNAYLK